MNFANLKSSFNTLSTVASNAAIQAASTVQSASNQVIGEHTCQICSNKVPKTQVAVGMATYEKCVVCAKSCCKTCVTKQAASDPVPQRIKLAENRDSTKPDWVCIQCDPIVTKTFMADFKKSFLDDLDGNTQQYLKNDEKVIHLHHMPGPIEDTYHRKLYRLAQVAEIVISNIGFKYLSYGFKAIKYAYMGTELYTLLISGDFLVILGPLGEAAKDILGREVGARGIIYLYYLACQQKLSLKGLTVASGRSNFVDPNYVDTTTPGLINAVCPVDILDLVGSKLDAAIWLYITKLPPPHVTSGWSCWYLDQLISRQKWSLLACIDETTKLRNKRKCPAFAIVARKSVERDDIFSKGCDHKPSCYYPASQQQSTDVREVLLLIRGSQSSMDWSLNLNEVPKDYSYLAGAHGDATVDGKAHGGMLEGALALLDDYGVRQSLLTLILIHGYKLTVVGHSLGAGVASFVITELKNSLHRQIGEFATHANLTLHHNIAANYVTKSPSGEYKINVQIPNMISAVTFATPPCMSENLTDTVCKDKLCICVVNSFDIVPRLSKVNMLTLVDEVKKCKPEAELWYEDDLKTLQDYAYSLGRAADMSQSQAKPATTASSSETKTSAKLAAASKASDKEDDKFDRADSKLIDEGRTLDTAKAESGDSDGEEAKGVDSEGALSTNELSLSTDTSATAGGLSLEELIRREVLLVVPGDIVYIYQSDCGRDQAAFVNHRLPALHRIMVIPERNLDDHKMKDHLTKLRNVRRNINYRQSKEHKDVLGEDKVPTWQSIYDDDSTENQYQTSNTSKAEPLSAQSAEDTAPFKKWTKCCVCTNDTTWVNILKSEGSRARNTHNCRMCGKIVCSICSPAGETLLGDGVSKSYVTHDYKLPLPELGMWDPQRVCLHCYFDSYRSLTTDI